MKSPTPRRVSKKAKAARAGGPKRMVRRPEKPPRQKRSPSSGITATQIWKALSQEVLKVPAQRSAFVGTQPTLNRSTKIDEVFLTQQRKRELAAKLERTFHVRLEPDEVDRAGTFGHLATLIFYKLRRPIKPLGTP